MAAVVIDDPPRMNLLGLILGNIVKRNANKPELKPLLDRIAGTVLITAREQSVTLQLDRGTLTIRRGTVDKPNARVRGSMHALMGLSLGEGLVGPVLSGRLKIGGNPFLLLKIRRIMLVA